MIISDKYTVEQKKDILKGYRKLLKALDKNVKTADKKKIREAFEIAVDAHKDMIRKSGEPYIHHPIAVAQIVAQEIGLGPVSVICALLHDVVEDTEWTLEEIELEFGKTIANMIDGLTKIDSLTASSSSHQAESFRKIIFTLGDDIRVIIIKLADRLHNMRTLDSMLERKQHKVASETLYLYAPLAHRLGLYAIKTELEDLSMKYTESRKYKEIAKKLNQKKRERDKFIKEFCEPISKEIENAGLKARVYGRPKSIASIANKMKKKDVEFEEVYDLFAIRIVIDAPFEKERDDIWRAYSIVASKYTPNPNRLRDWVSSPKANGYESLHTTVMGPSGKWVEVQIRSERMETIAEKGLAAHWKYKEGKSADNNIDKAFESWLVEVRELLKNPDTNPLEFLRDFKMNLFAQEIYVFTPKGEVRNIPKGSTALDFAFLIHTAVGSKCVGAKVNGKLMPLSHVLTNADQIEILTSPKQKPSEDWLNFVFTSRAKSKIKQALKEERKKIGEDGKELLIRKLKSIKANFNGENVQFLTVYFGMETTLDLYYNIALDKLDLLKLKTIPLERGNFTQPKPKREVIIAEDDEAHHLRETKTKSKKETTDIIEFGENGDHFAYEFAKCCEPIPGDDVIGFITVGGGVKIHRSNCKNVINSSAQYGYRIIKTSWKIKGDSSFLVHLRLKGTDDMGLINQITKIISNDYRVNIKGMNIETIDNVWLGHLKLFVKSDDQLNAIIKRLKKLNGIISVKRIEEDKEEEEEN
ncbi:MAG: bifunctional (p)ppGpp synthetase/guanosine-3',5'-bis(diphosphate) 3'-pyrophosphohydrolase [Chitinophagales bacterium]